MIYLYKANKYLGTKLVSWLVLFPFIWGCGGPAHYSQPNADIGHIKRIGVLPLENFTTDEYAGEKIRRMVITELLLRNIEPIEPGEVNRVLRELRVRSLSSINTEDMQKIGKALGVETIMMGSVENLGISKGISFSYPEVSIHLMLIEASSGSIIWSVNHSVGGAGFWTRHLGAEVATLSEAAKRVVRETISTFQWEKAMEDYEPVLYQVPSPEPLVEAPKIPIKSRPEDKTVKAPERIDKYRENLATHEFYVGRFYFKTKQYEAALGRFKGILKEYPNTGLKEELLEYINKCKANLER